MCGRFTLTTPTDDVAAQFEVPDPPLLSARYNVAPSQVIAVVGLKPDGKQRDRLAVKLGAGAELGERPERRAAAGQPAGGVGPRTSSASILREQRCLIPADGFYEWKTEGKKKLPHRFTLKSGEPFAFAGLWDVWRGEKETLLTCCLITTTANELVGAGSRPHAGHRPARELRRVARSRNTDGAAGGAARAVSRPTDAAWRPTRSSTRRRTTGRSAWRRLDCA